MTYKALDTESHFRSLERMYAAAPINVVFHPTLKVSKGKAVVEIELSEKFHHPAGAVHGSVYFKMLDDAAFFAASSLEAEVFLLTTSFNTHFSKPVISGRMKAVGSIVETNAAQYVATAVVYNADDQEIGRGNGVFVRSRQPLSTISSYG